ncbi:hypothetical protein [Erythrobacter sanguineus]|nr:hypothetical protein [Erythrobacter sanguineus]
MSLPAAKIVLLEKNEISQEESRSCMGKARKIRSTDHGRRRWLGKIAD